MTRSTAVSPSARSSHRRRIALGTLTGGVLIGASLTAFAVPASADTSPQADIICN